MGQKRKPTANFLEWLVDRRNRSQHGCYDLLKLLQENGGRAELKENSLTAQALVGAAFSLWRAVFLADKESQTGVPLAHSISFLERIVRTNAIAFPQELEANEWTFNYYLYNAESRLRAYPKLSDEWSGTRSSAMDRWDYCHKKLIDAVAKFAKQLGAVRA